MADSCLFCKMVSGAIQPDKVYETPRVLAFRDINPQAPVHVLVVPKQHVATLNEARPEDALLLGELLLAAREVAGKTGIAEGGYRTVLNCNADAGQTVFHIHLHVLGGRPMRWPPG
ncbi:MAG: histidine triad nucleotide-binding protein [Pseudomonadota bacterium]